MIPRLSIVLPVHNQADHIARVVEDYRAALAGLPDFELLLVENGSRDTSRAVCAELAAADPAVRLLVAERPGWGHAVRLGLAAAQGEILAYSNAARTAPADLRHMLDLALIWPPTVLKADRQLREGPLRRLGSALYNLEARLLFGVRLRDVNGTPKVFPRRFTALLALRRDDDLIDLEFCALCRREGYPVRQVPVTATARHGGRSTTGLGSAWRMYRGALALRAELGA
jgi:glycosyltransferase involved in cell wall biosynthesis